MSKQINSKIRNLQNMIDNANASNDGYGVGPLEDELKIWKCRLNQVDAEQQTSETTTASVKELVLLTKIQAWTGEAAFTADNLDDLLFALAQQPNLERELRQCATAYRRDMASRRPADECESGHHTCTCDGSCGID